MKAEVHVFQCKRHVVKFFVSNYRLNGHVYYEGERERKKKKSLPKRRPGFLIVILNLKN